MGEVGNFGDPLGLSNIFGYDTDMRHKELNNGRFAMFAAIGILAAELLTGKVGTAQLSRSRWRCRNYRSWAPREVLRVARLPGLGGVLRLRFSCPRRSLCLASWRASTHVLAEFSNAGLQP